MCKKCQKCVKSWKLVFCTKMTKKSWKKSFAKLGLVKMCVTFVHMLWPFLTHLCVTCDHQNTVLGHLRLKYILKIGLKMFSKTVLQKWSHMWHKMHTKCTHLENAQENELPWMCTFPKSGSFWPPWGPKNRLRRVLKISNSILRICCFWHVPQNVYSGWHTCDTKRALIAHRAKNG